MPVAGSILTALIAGCIPSRLGLPVLNLVVHPLADRASNHQEESESWTETAEMPGSDEDAWAGLAAMATPDHKVSTSLVRDSDAEILCDMCSREIQPGQVQFCWVMVSAGGHKRWVHEHCFPTFCCQEGIEEQALNALIDYLETLPLQQKVLRESVNAVISILMRNTANAAIALLVEDSQPL